MLRWVMIGITAGLTAVSLYLVWAQSWPDYWFPAIWPALLCLGLIFERISYKKELASPPGPGWVATDECTVDAAGTVRVWFNPRSGERTYVREQGGPPC